MKALHNWKDRTVSTPELCVFCDHMKQLQQLLSGTEFNTPQISALWLGSAQEGWAVMTVDYKSQPTGLTTIAVGYAFTRKWVRICDWGNGKDFIFLFAFLSLPLHPTEVAQAKHANVPNCIHYNLFKPSYIPNSEYRGIKQLAKAAKYQIIYFLGYFPGYLTMF